MSDSDDEDLPGCLVTDDTCFMGWPMDVRFDVVHKVKGLDIVMCNLMLLLSSIGNVIAAWHMAAADIETLNTARVSDADMTLFKEYLERNLANDIWNGKSDFYEVLDYYETVGRYARWLKLVKESGGLSYAVYNQGGIPINGKALEFAGNPKVVCVNAQKIRYSTMAYTEAEPFKITATLNGVKEDTVEVLLQK
jgi:hypothetical protein